MSDIIYKQGKEKEVIGKVLNTDEDLSGEIVNLGLTQNDPPTADIIVTNIP